MEAGEKSSAFFYPVILDLKLIFQDISFLQFPKILSFSQTSKIEYKIYYNPLEDSRHYCAGSN